MLCLCSRETRRNLFFSSWCKQITNVQIKRTASGKCLTNVCSSNVICVWNHHQLKRSKWFEIAWNRSPVVHSILHLDSNKNLFELKGKKKKCFNDAIYLLHLKKRKSRHFHLFDSTSRRLIWILLSCFFCVHLFTKFPLEK